MNSAGASSEIPINPLPLSSIGPPNAEDVPSHSSNDDGLVDLNELDKRFVENIFNSMRKEETFCGQVELMEWILDITNPSVKLWYFLKCFVNLECCSVVCLLVATVLLFAAGS